MLHCDLSKPSMASNNLHDSAPIPDDSDIGTVFDRSDFRWKWQ